MQQVKWNPVKSERLKRTRGVSFEDIISSKLIAIKQHPGREDQRIMIFEHKRYLWAVPCVVDKDTIFLKTIYPSRKLMKIYKREK